MLKPVTKSPGGCGVVVAGRLNVSGVHGPPPKHPGSPGSTQSFSKSGRTPTVSNWRLVGGMETAAPPWRLAGSVVATGSSSASVASRRTSASTASGGALSSRRIRRAQVCVEAIIGSIEFTRMATSEIRPSSMVARWVFTGAYISSSGNVLSKARASHCPLVAAAIIAIRRS